MSHDLYQETIPFQEGNGDDADGDSDDGGSGKAPSHPADELTRAPQPSATPADADGQHAPIAPQHTPAEVSASRPAPATKRRSAVDAAPPTAGDIVGHYELIREIGRGGMGVVYLARDLKLARRVAIKFIHAKYRGLGQRFVAEARATARCHHENIVIIHDIDDHSDHPYMVLEYLRGRTLSELSAGKEHSPARALALMIPVVRALQRAHAHGIVHRDLKPSNILVTESGTVKVLDFGIAKFLAKSDADGANADHSGQVYTGSFLSQGADSAPAVRRGGESGPVAQPEGHTNHGALLGTLPYMSPEQINEQADLDQRIDIWAVGTILFELLYGRHPLSPLNPGKLESVARLDEPMPLVADLVPHAGRLGSLIDRCLIKDRSDRIATADELLADLEALAERDSPKQLATDENPFTGLAAFQKADADRFYGRGPQIAHVVAQVQSQPLVTLVGPSGSGKSSLVRAGVIPTLERAGEGWQTLVMRPGRNPVDALSNLLGELNVLTSTEFGTEATTRNGEPSGIKRLPGRSESASLRVALGQRLHAEPGWFGQELRAWAQRKRRRILLFVDQFEELYTLVGASGVRSSFLRCLEGAADDASSPVRVVLAMRSDFLDRVVEDSQFMNEVTRGLIIMPPMERDGLRDALVKPVESAGYQFENEDLVSEMLEALDSTPGALPLLQFAASKLWDLRDREEKLLTRARYESFGGVAGALVVHGDAVLASMSVVKLRIARSIFERLVTLERTRAVITLGELRDLPGDTDTIEQVIYYLADARLLAIESAGESRRQRTSADPLAAPADRDELLSSGLYLGSDSSSVELIHESLIEGWPTLRRWLDEQDEDCEFMARLRAAATQWQLGGRNEGMLWTGEAAREAERWRQRYNGEIGEREGQYLAAVLAGQHRTGRIKILAASIMGFLLLLLIMAAVGYLSAHSANEEATKQLKRAEEALEQSRQAQKQETQARTEAEAARREAEVARGEAEAAKRAAEQARTEAETQAKAAHRAFEEADLARSRANSEAKAAKRSEAAAVRARRRADTDKARADNERKRARDEADHRQRVIERAVGTVKRTLQ